MKHKKRSKKSFKKGFKKNFTYKLLIISLLILVFLFIILIVIDIFEKEEVGEGLKGELGTISPFGEESIEQALLIESSMHSGVSPIQESQGQIIELKSKPFFKNRAGGIAYKQQIREEHSLLKQQIEQNLQKTIGIDIELLNEFEDVFNGITLDISEQECEFLKNRIDIIKECYSNFKVYALLDTSLEVMKINLAYSEFGLTGENITIAVIDTGIDASHESLDDLDDDPVTNDPKIIGFKDFVNFRTNSYDDMGHGTHCAGIAAGTGGSEGIYKGVAPQAKLVGVKVLNSWGSGYTSDVIAGIEWTIQNKDVYNISIISMSLGRSQNGDGTSPEEIAATTAVENGISFAVSAGNSGPSENTVGIPASAKKVITVGAIDDNKNIAGFSSRGPTKDDRIKPEVSAVGVDVISSVPKGGCVLCDSSGWMSLQGTSMAAPHVAGVVALIKQANSSLNTDEIRQLLMNTAEDRGEEGPDNTYGWGIVDTLNALLTIYPQDHELSIKNIESQKVYDTNTPIKITAVIKNNGLNDESNVKVRFLVDGIEQSNRIINLIEAGSETSLDFIYVSKQEGSFEISISIDPINGENIIFDNDLSKEIIVKDYIGKVKAVVLDSWGTGFYQYSIFPELNDNWFNYGDYKVEVDYESLYDKETTYDLLKNSKADVIIISDAWITGSWQGDWEFSDSEIQAIKQYINEGHGLIMTSGTLATNENVDNNMKLASLVGIDENSEPYWAEYMEDYDFDIYYLNHELFNNMDSYTYSYLTTVDLDLNEQDPGDILAKSYDDLSIITGHHYGSGNTIYFANMPESQSGGEDGKQIFYNAILWTSKNYEQKSYDLRLHNLSLESVIKYGETKNISAKLVNKGSVSERDINVRFLINNSEIQNITIASLAVGEEVNIEFGFTLTETGQHSIFIEVGEIQEETKIYDNSIGKNVFVPRASLTGIANDYGIDEDGDGLYDSLAIDIELDVIEADEFNLNGILTSQLGVEFGTSYTDDFLSPGLYNLTLKFNGLELRRIGLNGPYKLQDLELSEEQGQGTVAIDSLYETDAYSYDEFESYPDLSIYDIIKENEDDAKIIVNQSTKVQVEVQNTGTEDAFDVNVSLYQEDWETESLILINSSMINNISVFEEKSVIFEITPKKIGYVPYLINISDNEDENLENNVYWFSLEVLAESADVIGDFDYLNKAVINQETILTAVIRNRGVENAENVSVDFYKELSWDEYEFLDSQDIGNLAVDEIKELTLSLTPTELGELRIMGNITADNEINKENNRFYSYLNIVPEGADVTGNFYPSTYPFIINQQGKIEIFLENIGTQKANNVKATLYEDNGTLSQIASIDAGDIETDGYYYEDVSWTPTLAGENNFVLEITADNDANLENNEIEQNFYVRLESPDIRGYRDYSINKLILNQENNISFTIYNDGVTEAQNVLVSLYLREDYYWNGSDWVENSTLIDSQNIGSINVEDYKEIDFLYTPTQLGYIDFKINMSADNEAEEYKENNEDWFGLKVVSGADLSIGVNYITSAFINQEKIISSYIENDGAEDALNVLASLYLREDDYWNGSDWVENSTLIDSKNLGTIIIDEERKVNFSYTPAQLGYKSFKINVSADNEGNYEDNERGFGFEVVDNGPDIDVDLQTWKIDFAVVNNEVSIPAEISNIGNQDASDIQLTLYNVSWDAGEQLTQIEQKTITSLLASEKTTIEFQYTPPETGWIELKLVSSLVGDVYSNNNNDYGGLDVLNSLTDVSGLFLFYDSYAINNEINYLDIEVRDNDIIGAKNVLAELYDNETLVNSFFIPELNASDVMFFEDVEWTPTFLGSHNLTLIITADEDINLENNVYTEFINVYNKRGIIFNIRNYSGTSLSKYLTINENRFWVESSPYLADTVELDENNIGLDSIYYDETSGKEVFTVFLNSELNNEMNVTSDYYEDISDGDLLFDIIYANYPNWTYNNLSYYVLYYDAEKNFNDVSIYGCLDWDFSSLECQTEWIKNNETLRYIGEEGIYTTGDFDTRVVAIGLGSVGEISFCGDRTCDASESCSSCPADCGSCDGNGGNGGGGGSSGGSSSGGTNSETRFFDNKEPNESLKVDLDNQDLDIEFLGLRFVNEQQGGFINFRKIDSLENISQPVVYDVYSYFSIEHDIENVNIDDGNIMFRVEKQWLKNKNLDNDNIILLRYEDSWRELPTYYQDSDAAYNYYRSDINALSIFAISAKQSKEIKEIWLKIKSYVYVSLIVMMVALILIILLIKLTPKLKKEKELITKAKDFVKEAKEKGMGAEKIKEMFRKKGWKEKKINKIIRD
jgi:hypothetical protein